MDEMMNAKEVDLMIDWFKAHGLTAEDAADCIKYIANNGKK